MIGLNAGSGQRPFDKTKGWVNLDLQDKHHPDIVADWTNMSMFTDCSMDYVVSHHSIEHVGCGEADAFIRESRRILRTGGSLLIFIPDIRALAQRWLTGQISDYIYIVNLMGAYLGDEADRHRWHYTRDSLTTTLRSNGEWSKIKPFDWRLIDGADIARDFWILGMEAVK